MRRGKVFLGGKSPRVWWLQVAHIFQRSLSPYCTTSPSCPPSPCLSLSPGCTPSTGCTPCPLRGVWRMWLSWLIVCFPPWSPLNVREHSEHPSQSMNGWLVSSGGICKYWVSSGQSLIQLVWIWIRPNSELSIRINNPLTEIPPGSHRDSFSPHLPF